MKSHYDEYARFLQSLKEELLTYKAINEEIQPLIVEELQDIEEALGKWEEGFFGVCERSGDPIPGLWLENVPTLKCTDDWKGLLKFGRVSIPFN